MPLLKNVSVSQMSQVLAAVCAVSCLLAAGANSYTVFDPPCSKNPLARCLAGIDLNGSNMEFCAQSRSAMTCITRVLQVCFTRNDPNLLVALSMVDLTTFFEKHRSICG
ncbi:hypothetical protein PoB_005456200 [Plakobranchus ocellatus]|uniref:Uncharacterized protein n=1 Tax=Plakobranchus ocellatus TaxID=259542 RepID=A0AAV4C9M0_9GAST|nr:hypothetical protein PoB_005456200 [Plakobranchus ocellatus]